MKSEFTGSLEDRAFVNEQAAISYERVSKWRHIPLSRIYACQACDYIADHLRGRLANRWDNVEVVRNYDLYPDDLDQPPYGHSFLTIGPYWAVDPDWQFFLNLNDSHLQKARRRLFPQPKVLTTLQGTLLYELTKRGVPEEYLVNWDPHWETITEELIDTRRGRHSFHKVG